MANKFFISDKVGDDKLSHSEGVVFGKAHYSWKIISKLYREALQISGAHVSNITRPEIYQSQTSLATINAEPTDFHLAIKPTEELRPMPGVRNLYVCGWEFPEISESDYGVNPFYNQRRVLRLADAIFCWSDYTRDNLRQAGLKQAFTLPPPIDNKKVDVPPRLPAVPCIPLDTQGDPNNQQVYALDGLLPTFGSGTLFVSVLNPYDERKCLSTMLHGFLGAIAAGIDAYLIIKLVIDNVGTTVGNINEILLNLHDIRAKSKRILFVGHQLSDHEMTNLLAVPHYYLCTSSCEGLNLPVVSALRQGTPVVSTWNSAMGTYLDGENSIEIECQPALLKGKGHALAAHMDVTHFPPTPSTVKTALIKASSLSRDNYKAMRSSSIDAAERHFGMNRFSSRLSDILNHLN